MILIGDIGGTKIDLALVDHGRRGKVINEKTFQCADYGSLEDIIAVYLTEVGEPVVEALFGAAGPVRNGFVKLTNLPWIIEENSLARSFGFSRIKVINDVEAIAHAVPTLKKGDVRTLNPGRPSPSGAVGVIAPGTGLGMAFLSFLPDGRMYVRSSEGGHCDFAPRTVLEYEIHRYLRRRHKHVSYERVCSGLGIANIYRFLRDERYYREPQELTEKLSKAADITPVIVERALDNSIDCELCRMALTVFCNLLGAVSGNFALMAMAAGGIYLGGGIPPRVLPLLMEDSFMKAFLDKGRMSEILVEIPVHVIMVDRVNIRGLAQATAEWQKDSGE